MSRVENHEIPAATSESWRAWMMTGARTTPVSRRRLRGTHSGLKKILVEGLANGNGTSHTWQDFSGAMVRHAVDDAMRSLPPQQAQVVKLAYFGGYSNQEIGREVGVAEWTVKRRLRAALHAISEHLEHGRALGTRVVCGIALFLSGRWLGDVAQNTFQAAGAAAVAAVIVVGQPAITPAAVADPPRSQHTQPGAGPAPALAITPVPTGRSTLATVTAPAEKVTSVESRLPLPVPPVPRLIHRIEQLL